MNEAAAISPMLAMIWLAVGYLFGSVPFGLLLARLGGLGDVRTIGSGNIGATNVLRTGSKKIALATLTCDILKGAAPVYLATIMAGETTGLIAGFGSFIGHVLPVWLRFKGGKGVATYLGVLFAAAWPLAVGFIAVWLILAALFRYSSISSLGACLAMPIAAWSTGDFNLTALTVAIAAVVFYAHRGNIARLRRGEESKIRLKGSAGSG